MYDRDRVLNMLGWGAFAFAASVFFLPVLNPDIYWHLSAGKYTLAHLGPPRTDFLSWPLAGAEWVDFEWLPQVFYYLLHKAGGFRALLLFKVLVLALTLLQSRGDVLRGNPHHPPIPPLGHRIAGELVEPQRLLNGADERGLEQRDVREPLSQGRCIRWLARHAQASADDEVRLPVEPAPSIKRSGAAARGRSPRA